MFKEHYLKNGRYDSSDIEIGVLMRDIHEDTVPLHLERCPTSFVFHLAHLLIKLKYDPRTSLAPETGAPNGNPDRKKIQTFRPHRVSLHRILALTTGFGTTGSKWCGALVNIQLNKSY
ncbi:hypothetical protein AVEN_91912-1 [Araneus ventricosus]|uniref:Uncharacterized protein n=1 Tax=Araneus ventricosus TaxID=182803 RepID=A0A4Y2Q9U4_ARAVE|nr:hypothetical protein AVEN_252630-1 [Araneus ventricosus]GBN60938.1 hypothetical protein AVEN_8585-1 [Araneus ventricosus]GBN60947.1 hypothetical protein AVEN_25511-1 [Araneus ventricosus]GBN60968.1 hypothetical protein AVEN_91912-1 [Araneus ventricosus]